MKYFLSTNYNEYKTKPLFGKPVNTIDLISIGIISEEVKEWNHSFPDKIENITGNGLLDAICQIKMNSSLKSKEYYAISKDFNLKVAWKNEWVRENILKQIFKELYVKDKLLSTLIQQDFEELWNIKKKACRGWLKYLLNKYGKTNKQIAQEIIEFTNEIIITHSNRIPEVGVNPQTITIHSSPIEFYGYYSDYDWVIFCQLFGTMINLPKCFPMYCKDLKQYKDEVCVKMDYEVADWIYACKESSKKIPTMTELKEVFKYENDIENCPNYPKQTNKHNALTNAKWNYELYKFLNTL